MIGAQIPHTEMVTEVTILTPPQLGGRRSEATQQTQLHYEFHTGVEPRSKVFTACIQTTTDN